MTEQHWGNYLVRGFPADQDTEVTFPVNAENTRPGMVVVASRIAGLMAALGPEDGPDGDPLSTEDSSEIGRLLDHLHRVRLILESQEERLIELLADRGVSLRTIALHLKCSPTTVANRRKRIAEAGERGLSAAGLDEVEPQVIGTE